MLAEPVKNGCCLTSRTVLLSAVMKSFEACVAYGDIPSLSRGGEKRTRLLNFLMPQTSSMRSELKIYACYMNVSKHVTSVNL